MAGTPSEGHGLRRRDRLTRSEIRVGNELSHSECASHPHMSAHMMELRVQALEPKSSSHGDNHSYRGFTK